ncbi:hypothetical protein [Bradyrhizobium liaoningense]|uniref:hypothetical protein n=1 Tax=Bradyrhizobium liaoningense TaxID=43992 RepID=UPI001BABE664|nr:hypothetical protein [Bradyrhizobium liaoningense]MBR0906963.1 hypothetical protein [Bradyrhizobium liaoningense]
MATAKELMEGTALVTGLPPANVQAAKRRLIETGIWEPSTGSHVPEMTTYSLVMMLLALLADVPGKDMVSAACSYYGLVNDEGDSLGEALTRLIDSFNERSIVAPLAYRSRLEIDCGYPRACLSIETTEGQLELLFGPQAKKWADEKVRRSMTISGKCLFDLACGLHFNQWPHRA